MKRLLLSTVLAACAGAVACGESSDSGPGRTGGGGAAGSAGTAGGAGATSTLDVRLPQAVDGALQANQKTYAEIPLHVAVNGEPTSVEVGFRDETYPAMPSGGDWVAMLPLDGLEDGSLRVVATATAGDETATAEAELVVSHRGTQLTDFDEVGAAGTPRLHRRGEEAWITFTDRSAGDREAYLHRIDGAGRLVGDRIPLVHSATETQYARTAFGESSIGVLYQQAGGGPYDIYFEVVDFDGNEKLAPMHLNDGLYGSFGGDITFDGSAFVAVWRLNDGMGHGGGEVRWMRVDEATGTVTGPAIVADSGAGDVADPKGGYEPFSFVKVATVGKKSLVTFVRGLYMTSLAFEIPKSQLAIVDSEGKVTGAEYLGGKSELRFHREARVFGVGDGAVAVWSSSDLLDPEPNSRQIFQGSTIDSEGVIDGAVKTVVDAADDRDEPFLIEHPEHFGVLAWMDHRSYAEDLLTGRIELFVAPVDADLGAGSYVTFEHADPIAGMGQVHGTSFGTNVLVVWLDDIGGVANPRPEVYVDTAWF